MAAHKNHQDKKFKHLREVVKWLHQNECYICHKNHLPLEVHHLDKDSKNHVLQNLVPVCKQCHVYLGRVSVLRQLTVKELAALLRKKEIELLSQL